MKRIGDYIVIAPVTHKDIEFCAKLTGVRALDARNDEDDDFMDFIGLCKDTEMNEYLLFVRRDSRHGGDYYAVAI